MLKDIWVQFKVFRPLRRPPPLSRAADEDSCMNELSRHWVNNKWRTQKDSLCTFKIASEASYVYISSGQKFIDNAEISQFSQFLKTWNWRGSTRQVNFNSTKNGGKYPNSKLKKGEILSVSCSLFQHTVHAVVALKERQDQGRRKLGGWYQSGSAGRWWGASLLLLLF